MRISPSRAFAGISTLIPRFLPQSAYDSPFPIIENPTPSGRAGYLKVIPPSSFVATQDGFDPAVPFVASYTLFNTGGTELTYRVSVTNDWLSVYYLSGPIFDQRFVQDPLRAGYGITVNILINSRVGLLPVGINSDTIVFQNITSGQGNATRDVTVDKS